MFMLTVYVRKLDFTRIVYVYGLVFSINKIKRPSDIFVLFG